MDISTPWTPSYEGKPCKPCAWYASVVEENIHPNCIQHADWAQKNLEPQLGKRPLARDALWEGILALWRLSLQEGDGRKEESWRVLVFAWLKRHRDLCHHLKIAPFQVVRDFGTQFVTGLEEHPEWIPYLEWTTPGPEFQPELRREPGQALGKARVATPQRVNPDSDDAEVVMVPPIQQPPGVLKSTGKARARSKADTTVLVPDSEGEKSDVGGVGKKRGRSGSASPVSASVKRVRSASSHKETKASVDLSARTFQLGSAISKEAIPRVEKKVCARCTKSGKDATCRPLWQKKRGNVTVGCKACKESKYACSFGEANWGVSKWPTLTEVPKKNASSGNKQKVEPVQPTSEQGQGSAKSKPFVEVPRLPDRLKFARAAVEDTVPASPVVHPPSPVEKAPASSSSPNGETHSIVLEDLTPYFPPAGGPNFDPAVRRLKAIKLRALCYREKVTVQALAFHVSSRLEVAQSCLLSLIEEDEEMGGPGESSAAGGDRAEDPFAQKVRREVEEGFWTLVGMED